jgi:DNA modification methylase
MVKKFRTDKEPSRSSGTSQAPWPADRVERWPIEKLVPYAHNVRLHSKADIDAVAASIGEWGWTMPALVAEGGMLIAGHLRLLAAQRKRIKFIPVMVARGWTDAQIRAYRIADNQLSLRASWDADLLSLELSGLKADSFDLNLIGFEPDQLVNLLGLSNSGGQTDPDFVPEVEEQATSRRADTWRLGRHRVRCGDATDPADVKGALGRTLPTLMVSDPPYGVAYEPSWRAKLKAARGKHATGKVLNDDRADWRDAWALFSGDVAYVWHGSLQGAEVASGLAACGFQLRAQIVWAKQHFVLSRGDYHWQHETCWYAVRKGASGHWTGDRTQTTLWQIANNNAFGRGASEESWGHGTQKPVDCILRPILNNSNAGQAVYDPFLGSGTTVIAAEISGRSCHGLELHPPYVDVIVRRWEAFTGQEATLEETGQSFKSTAAERSAQRSAPRSGVRSRRRSAKVNSELE